MKHFSSSLLFFILLLLSASCAHVISEQYRQQAMKDVSFGQLLQAPDKYLNKTFILGGTIVETKNRKTGSEIEIIENPVDQYGEIVDKDVSEGRFILLSPLYLDPKIYRENRRVTMAGKLIGTRTAMLGDVEYVYPLLEAEEIYLWKSTMYYYQPYPYVYDPFFYPYPWYDPFWYGPHYYPYP